MPLDLRSSIKKTSKWAFGSSLLNGILSSCLFVAILISFIMVLLVMLMYPAKNGSSFSIICKMFLYMFLISLFVIFLHDGVIKYMFDEEQEDDDVSEMLDNITKPGDITYGNKIQVKPNITDGTENKTEYQTINANKESSNSIPPKIPAVSVVEGGGGDLRGLRPARTQPQLSKTMKHLGGF